MNSNKVSLELGLRPISITKLYKGYTMYADKDGYKILGSYSDPEKLHVLRRMPGSAGNKKVHDHHGNRLYTRYESLEIAVVKATEYIDQYPERLELSLSKKKAKKDNRVATS